MNIKHESIADIPLIIGFCKRLGLESMINHNLNTHGNQSGLSNGQLVVGWITHILTQNNHCKSPVEEWVQKHKLTLQALLNSNITDTDFEDCRLSRLLEKFADNSRWENFESTFYRNSISIFQLDTKTPEHFKECPPSEDGIKQTIKVDSTTAYGHHEVVEDGIMQRGWSKDHRSDLPQLKIMASVQGSTGVQIATEVVPGNKSDDPLYVPILERTRKIIDTTNCLICGDCKMSATYIRANIVKNKEFYLTPLQLSSNTKDLLNNLIEKIVNEDQNAELIFDRDVGGNQKIIGAGFEIQRTQIYKNDDEENKWEERVMLIRSYDHAKQEISRFNDKLKKAKETFGSLESKLCPGKEDAEADLFKKIEKFKNENECSQLFKFEIEVFLVDKINKRTEKRNGKTREGSYKTINYRARIINISEDQDILSDIKRKIGFRLYVTNAPQRYLTFANAYTYFRKTMYVIEIGFHVLKDHINISPLFVRNQKQILGMTRLLILALKILTLMTAEIRANMKKDSIILEGLYAGQKSRKHQAPTAQSILEYLSRQEIAVIGHKIGEVWHWGITPLTVTCRIILKCLKIPESVYESLPSEIARMG
jgi:transposase